MRLSLRRRRSIMAEEKLDTQVRREQIAEAALSLVADQGLRRAVAYYRQYRENYR